MLGSSMTVSICSDSNYRPARGNGNCFDPLNPSNKVGLRGERAGVVMAATQVVFPAVEAGDLGELRRLLDADPGLVHVRHADPELHHFTPLQFAAAKGRLEVCRLLVERG